LTYRGGYSTPGKCWILTDSFSSAKILLSHRTHLLVYERKRMCSELLRNGVEAEKMWIPSHVGLEGNELVNKRARNAALNGAVCRPLPPVDFQGLARSVLLREWQEK
jgi:hypothetical protein